jgi:hypothetical protein
MPIDFPNSPTVNQLFTVGPRTWRWTGSIWEAVGGPGVVASSVIAYGNIPTVTSTNLTSLVSQAINNPAPGTIFKVYITGTYTNTSGANRTATVSALLGSTTVFSSTSPNFATSASNTRSFILELNLISQSNTSQRFGVTGSMSGATAGNASWGTGTFDLRSDANLSVNTSSSQLLDIRWQSSGTGTSLNGSYTIERIFP